MSKAPRRGLILHYLARAFFFVTGWRVQGQLPDLHKYVIVMAPHTSHWDSIYYSAGSCILRLKGNYMIKHTVFRGPMGWVLRRLGGIPVHRGEGGGQHQVDQAISAFKERDYMVLVLAPEGTRAKRDYWRSGFYRIAHGAGVPVQLVYADFAKKEVGAGPLLEVTGDVEADLGVIREFYANIQARHPERFSPVRFRE